MKGGIGENTGCLHFKSLKVPVCLLLVVGIAVETIIDAEGEHNFFDFGVWALVLR